jgi:hypothetical protein
MLHKLVADVGNMFGVESFVDSLISNITSNIALKGIYDSSMVSIILGSPLNFKQLIYQNEMN